MKPFIVFCLLLSAICSLGQHKAVLIGAWSYTNQDYTHVAIYTNDFFAVSVFNVANKQFSHTYGGQYELNGDQVTEFIEFDSKTPDSVRTERKLKCQLANGLFTLGEKDFKRVDDGTPGQLGGAWVITGRIANNQIRKMTPGARRTMKILSGTRFQWIAYNIETKEFFGTGGGSYTTVDGKYTENIEFFSRDNSRVGKSLSFDFSFMDGNWHHQGSSSKGDPVDEIWTQREKLGL